MGGGGVVAWWRAGELRAGVSCGEGSGNGAVCGSLLLGGASGASLEASVAPRRPCAVLPGTLGGGSPPPSMDLPCRGVAPGEVGAAAGVVSGTGPVVVGWGPPAGDGLWGGWAPSAWTWCPGGYGSW